MCKTAFFAVYRFVFKSDSLGTICQLDFWLAERERYSTDGGGVRSGRSGSRGLAAAGWSCQWLLRLLWAATYWLVRELYAGFTRLEERLGLL